jgi:hypothetical protein
MNLEEEDFDNLYEISQEIFCNNLKSKKSIILDLDDSCKNEKTLFDILLIMAKNGIHLLFRKNDPLDLTSTEFNLLNSYFNSFGFNIKFSAESFDDTEFLIKRPDQLKSLLEAGYNFDNYKIEFEFL